MRQQGTGESSTCQWKLGQRHQHFYEARTGNSPHLFYEFKKTGKKFIE
jgi:hypothetical protein